jgi:putative Mg2+ transporter-C (MgtC) family protein
MLLYPTWQEIAFRILLTFLAGVVLGLNRGSKSQAAGFRTIILVGLAACTTMIQANILLGMTGKPDGSFVSIDVMRLPLGILTGVGFIGGGSILKRGDFVKGVTTAATLWIITVIGLCFGGGQWGLGLVATFLSVMTLWVLKWLDRLIPRDHRAKVVIKADKTLSIWEINELVKPLGYFVNFQKKRTDLESGYLEFSIYWKRPNNAGPPLDLLQVLEDNYHVESFEL